MAPRAVIVVTGIVALVPVLPAISFGTTWLITPAGTGDAPTIQAGIDSAAAADTVLLADGTYLGYGNRDIDLLGKAITVRSQSNDPDACIIDCQPGGSTRRGFLFRSGEGPQSVLQAVTIQNGSADFPDTLGGAGILCSRSSPTLIDCKLVDGEVGGVS